ncbi:hypothetical protein GALMADRAFT_250248 [Galerina marginata CBS 339.88]|uniref:CRAL-TRIO domain-containing protein n=1 Tax=Galerina marginata (strain CBS 339.88) TaxID=685588 RepID=A0A067STV8_GALM3|nr:hypothetical protein GALMADRAFT_250248 [Galerina marginata CBS 339.88]
MSDGVTDPNYRPESGHLGNLTPVQQEALEKLKQEMKDDGAFVPERMDDAMLLRFLRARRFDLVKAKAMLLDAEKWRKDFGVDDVVKNFEFTEKLDVNKYYPQYYHKTDKDGRPVYIERLGQLDVTALYALTTEQRLLKHLVSEYGKCLNKRFPACSAACGHPVENLCTILDLGGVSLSNFIRVKDFVFAAASIGQDRYPETLGKFYIINAPWAFSMVWAVIKPWLDEVTVRKVTILGGSYKEELLKQIPVENFPKEFGGTCECTGGCSMSDAGPWNPVEQ